MADKTVNDRVRRQRELRSIEGWQEVKVWVPTEADAEAVRTLAAERRARAEALAGLSQEVRTVSYETESRIAQAIADHGSSAYTTPSGPVLTLMSELADEDDLLGFARAVVILSRAKPANAAFVTGAVPGKINNFIIRHRGIKAADLMRWVAAHPGYTDELKKTVRNPAIFERAVEEMVGEIKQWLSAH